MRDYLDWHRTYDDPDSTTSWRLGVVRDWISEVLDERRGRLAVLSVCAGDGRDLLGALADRPADRERVHLTLLEILPELCAHAEAAATELGVQAEVRCVDGGDTASYAGAVPADLVLLVGIFGNISDEDVMTTVDAAGALCAPGATLLWSRGRNLDGVGHDLNDAIRKRFLASGFEEVGYETQDRGSRPAIGRMRYVGAARTVPADASLFSFRR